jgi:poly(3-hydroxybutyrate) depolymerase
VQDEPDGEAAARTLEKVAYHLDHRGRDFRFVKPGWRAYPQGVAVVVNLHG